MSQMEILDVLKKEDGLTSKEIATELKTERKYIAPYLTRLLHNKLIKKDCQKKIIYYINRGEIK